MWRHLRYYERVAQKIYCCSNCDIPIFPGDRYGAIIVVDRKRLKVDRFHLGCPCDPDEDRKHASGCYSSSSFKKSKIEKAA